MLVRTIKNILMSAGFCALSFCSVMPAAIQPDPKAVLSGVERDLALIERVFDLSEKYALFRASPLSSQEHALLGFKNKLETFARSLGDVSLEKQDVWLSQLQKKISLVEKKIDKSKKELQELSAFHSGYAALLQSIDATVILRVGGFNLPSLGEMTFSFMETFKAKVARVRNDMARERVTARPALDAMTRIQKAGYALAEGAVIRILFEQEDLRLMLENLVKGPLSVVKEDLKTMSETVLDRADESGDKFLRNGGQVLDDLLKKITVAGEKSGEVLMGKAVGWGTLGATTFGALALGFYAADHYLAKGIKAFEKPNIVEETNISSLKKHFTERFGLGHLEDEEHCYPLFSDIVLDAETAQEFASLKFAINNVKETKGVFRNILLCGAPGAGKTMSVRALAHETNCHWMYLAASSLFKIEKTSDVLQEIDALFAFAENQSKPTMIILDDMDLIFKACENLSENARKIMTHIKQKMGAGSSKFFVVAVTRKSADLDEGIRNCFSKKIEIKFPHLQQRVDIIKKYIERDFAKKQDQLNAFDDGLVNSIALKTKGYSGRSLMFLIGAIRNAFAASGLKELTAGFIQAVVCKEVEESLKEETGFKREKVLS